MRSLRVLMVPVLIAGFGLASGSTASLVLAQPGPGGNLNAFESRLQSAFVDATVESVPNTQSLSGLRTFEFGLGDFGSAVTGAQITLHGSGNPSLNSADFDWRYQLFAGQGPPQGFPQPCTSSATDVSCPPAGMALTSGAGLQAFSSGHGGPGGPGLQTTFNPPFDSARRLVANHVTVTATLTDASFGGGDLQVDLPNGMAPTPNAQVATANGTVPACPPGPPSGGTCAQTGFNAPPNSPCGGGWFLTVHQAQLGTQYTFTADQASCASGTKPMVVVSASLFAPGGPPVTGASVSQNDTALNATITWAVSTANSWNIEVQNQVQIQYQGTGQAGPGPGGNLNASETRVQSAMVGPEVDMVASTQSFSGLRTWQLGLGNFGSTPLAGAQITVHSGTRTLNNASQFHWTWQLFSGPTPPQVPPTDCSASATDVSCGGPAGSPLTANSSLQASSSGNPGPGGVGVSTPVTPPFDSARMQTANHETVTATLTGASFGGGDLQVDLPNGMAPNPAAQVTTASGAVATCPQEGPPNGTCAQAGFNAPPNSPCGGGWFLTVHQAQLGTQYTFTADQASCASGKPMVVVGANQFVALGAPISGVTSVSQTDADLGTITYSVSAANSFSTTVQNQVSIQYQGTGQPGPGGGGHLRAFETRVQTASVGSDVDMVSSTQSFSGLQTWELGLFNPGTTPVAGAKITVTSSTRALNDSAQFHWTWQLPTGPNSPGPPVDCSASATEVSCGGPAGSPLADGGLHAFSSGHPGPGGPGVHWTVTPPFNSARHLAGSHVTVPVTLTDAGFGRADLTVNLPDGFQPSGAQVTTANGPVPDCPMGGPPSGTCSQKDFFAPPNSSCGVGWFLNVNGAQVGTEYTFSADRAACASGKPMVMVGAGQFPPGGPPISGVTSVSQTDTDLEATITYSVSTPNSFGIGVQNQVVIQYQPGVTPTPTPAPTPTPGPIWTLMPTPTPTWTLRPTPTATPTPTTPVLATTGGGASAPGHLAALSYFFGWVLFGFGCLLLVRLVRARLRRQ